VKCYLDVQDTCVECGITRRQLNYWLLHDLLQPELGVKALKYTERDLAQLNALRRLIVDLGIPPRSLQHPEQIQWAINDWLTTQEQQPHE
jgi:DNA-binding transcriptional MerR regulator